VRDFNPAHVGFGSNSTELAQGREATVGMPLPLHPGAERYFRDMGILR
jgi:TRAP-type uncharacterized transport system substrate-binding protein